MLNKHFRIIITLFNAQFYPRRDEGIYNFTRNIYKVNNVYKSNRQRHSNNIQTKNENKFRLVIYSLRNTERVPFGTIQKRRSLRKGLENIMPTL